MKKKNYRHIFFDLDDTLRDFRTNSGESLRALYSKYALDKTAGISSVEEFISKYQERNVMMWEQYRLGAIDKTTLRSRRFELTFWDMGIDSSLVPPGMAEDYLAHLTSRSNLFPHTRETLEYLSAKYSLCIITNGFPDVQEKIGEIPVRRKRSLFLNLLQHSPFQIQMLLSLPVRAKHAQSLPMFCKM